MPSTSHHPVFDLAHWRKVLPQEVFEKTLDFRRFDTTPRNSPLDLWKIHGEIITSPAHLCATEYARKALASKRDLGQTVPVDLFVWRTGPPERPYLTKLGGIPHRERDTPWPKDRAGAPMTFLAQFCFADSREIVSGKLGGDVLLMFWSDVDSWCGDPEDIHFEWSNLELRTPARSVDCPAPRFLFPELAGLRHRTFEYPEAQDAFEAEGHYMAYLLATTQSTKIGRETHFIQNDPRSGDTELLCALSSIHPDETWPFANMEALPKGHNQKPVHYGWGRYEMMFGDVGCLYVLIDAQGRLSWAADCY
ncbi:MAG: DUF1963 domain-containing protein [Planctomycetes bacterium]|nr:DUF1963 domain-containing protein [Planctomycetota bacterium]